MSESKDNPGVSGGKYWNA